MERVSSDCIEPGIAREAATEHPRRRTEETGERCVRRERDGAG